MNHMKKIGTFLALLVLAVFVVLFFVIPNLHWTSPEGLRTHCMSNLSQIGKALMLYSKEHDGAFPKTIQALTNFCENPKLYICRSSGHTPGPITNLTDWTDYTYIPNPTTNMVWAFCPPKNHNGTGGNILFVDGSVCWYDADRFRNVLKNGRKALTKN